jgi:hypothetical protein
MLFEPSKFDLKLFKKILLMLLNLGCNDTQHNDIKHNDTQQIDHSIMTFSITINKTRHSAQRRSA